MPVRTASQDSSGRRALGALRLAAEVALVTLAFIAASIMHGGTLTWHMIIHIALMNIAAPWVAWNLLHVQRGSKGEGKLYVSLSLATAGQLVIFCFWHTPLGMAAMTGFYIIRLLAMGTLFASAVWFWLSVFVSIRQGRITAIFPLLLTGKIFCLIAAILVFAPRLLYTDMPPLAAAMTDQQLAGLIMLTACPLTYVGASIIILARWYNALADRAETA